MVLARLFREFGTEGVSVGGAVVSAFFCRLFGAGMGGAREAG